MRLAFLGTPEPAVPILYALVAAGHDVAHVVTRPDRRRGRGSALSPSPVKAAARERGIPVGHDVDAVLDVGAELGVVVAYGRLIKPHVLDALAMLNVHFSLLPRWRGAAPVERALLAGDSETGVSIMGVVDELDAGPVYVTRTVPIGARVSAAELRDELVDAGAELLVATLARPLPDPTPQHGEPTYAAKLDPAELRLDWARTAIELDRWVRVGGAWTSFRQRRLKVLAVEPVASVFLRSGPGALDGDQVATGDGALRLITVQPEGKAPMAWTDFANGAHLTPDGRLGP